MPVIPRTPTRTRFVLFPALLAAGAIGLAAEGQPPDAPKKPADPPAKADPKAKDAPVVKLPDGTFLWVGNPPDGAGVSLTPQELQKLYDQIDQLKKQLAARKPAPPSGCAVRARVEKRGEQFVAVLKLTCTFRTTQPQSAVALGGRRGFLVSASLDGNKPAVLDTTEDGLAVLAETPGDHTLVLELEAPVTARGGKPEVGFEIGLPRAPITTLVLDPPGAEVKRVNLTTRTPDPGKAGPPDPRRTPGLDVKQLAARPGEENGLALGPVDSVEVAWDPPAAAQSADQAQAAEIDVRVVVTEGVVESTARVKFRGPAREWKLVAPATADVSADRVETTGGGGPAQAAVVTRPGDQNKPVWKVELPAGSSAADWVVTAVTRQPRPKPEDARHRGPFAVGPVTVLDVLRQTGTVKVTAGPHTHFTFKHGPDLRRAEAAEAPADDTTAAYFRLTTGPTGTTPVNAPLFTVEARPQDGAVKVRPQYQLTWTDAGWRVRADVRVTPLRTELDTLTVEVPADWHGLEASPPELVEGVQPGVPRGGFWAAAGVRFAGGLRVPVAVRLATPQKQPFDLVLTATVPVEAGDTTAVVPLPRFPGAVERDAAVTATVPEGLEVRGETRDWDGEYAAWGSPLAPEAGPDGKAGRTAVTGRGEAGFSRVRLVWNPHRPELAADLRADVTIGDRQVVVVQQIKLRSPEGLPRPVRLRGLGGAGTPAALRTVPAQPGLDPAGPGEWTIAPAPGSRELAVTASFAVPLPAVADPDAPRTVPVLLLWPTTATRIETTVRVWSGTAAGRVISGPAAGWREVTAEAAPERDTLPALTLTATGVEPLALDTRAAGDSGAVTVWADRGLVQAWGADDGATSYRARFLLRRWLAPAVEVRLPGPAGGPSPEFLRDGQRLDVPPGPGGERVFRVPVPAAKPGATTVVEVRYQLPAARGRGGEVSYAAPVLPGAAFAGPVRWHVTGPDGTTPLLAAGGAAEFRWRPLATGFAPVAVESGEELDRWFRSGEEADGGAADARPESLVVRQSSPESVVVYRVPRVGWVIACSVAAFVLVLVLSHLPAAAVGFGLGVVGCAAGVAAVYFPHPAAQVAGGCQAGVVAAAAALLALAAARGLHRRRVNRMPGFSRSLPEPEPSAAVPSSARTRPSGVGSVAPANPSGG